ncbi:MAG: S8 family serine peptidase [Caldilineaceae bacterium]|nr:S8 family serine peptidase [Caldilineaceae bacterium]
MQSHTRHTLLSLCLLFLLAFSWPGVLKPVRAEVRDGVELSGIVVSAPGQADGIGQWQIRNEEEGAPPVWLVEADAATEFKNGVPSVGDRVEVNARVTDDGTLYAEEIDRHAGDGGRDPGHEDEEEFRGLVLARPAQADGVGEWSLQSERDRVLTILVTAETYIIQPQPMTGEWAKVEGLRQADDAIVAGLLVRDDFEGNEVVIRLAPEAEPEAFADRHELDLDNALLASANIFLFHFDDDKDDARDAIQALRQDGEVIWAELNFAAGAPVGDPYRTWGWGGVEPTDYENQTAFDQVNLAAASAVADGSGVTVAVLDTGVNVDHPALTDLLLTGRDLVDDDLLPDEAPDGLAWGHGTHTTGIIAHIAPNSRILPVRVLDLNGRGNTFLLAYAIEWAVAQGADVINLSLGTPFDSTVLRVAIEDAISRGVVIVAAAGNDNADAPQYPAAYPGVVAVTAVDENGVKADFANYGRGWIDLAAPGVGIVSTIVGPEGSGYATWSGTSMAAPFASAAAALVAEGTEPHDVANRLLAGAGDLDSINPAYAGQLGGMLDIGAALGQEDIPVTARTFLPIIVR